MGGDSVRRLRPVCYHYRMSTYTPTLSILSLLLVSFLAPIAPSGFGPFTQPLIHANEETADLQQTATSGTSVRVYSSLSSLQINQLHSWRLAITDAQGNPVSGADVSVVGGMPEHDHGLPTQPLVTDSPAPGHYTLQGVRFHMPGKWQMEFVIATESGTETLLIEFEL